MDLGRGGDLRAFEVIAGGAEKGVHAMASAPATSVAATVTATVTRT